MRFGSVRRHRRPRTGVSGSSPSSPMLRPIDADADAERAEILVAVGLELRLVEDLLQDLSGDVHSAHGAWVRDGPRRSVSQFFSWAVWSFQPSSVLRMNWAACSRLTAAWTSASGAGLPTSSTKKAARLASVRGRSRMNSSRQMALATRNAQP